MNVVDGEGVLDVTRSLQRLMVENRPLRLTVTAGGDELHLSRVDLSLLVSSEN